MRHEIRLLFTAVQFYTRLPVPAWVGYSDTAVSQATRYFPVIGWLVGFVMGGSWLLASYAVDIPTGVVVAIVVSVLVTGAFHEDGFADSCDGFGGGWTKPKILDIMKDSRVGTYGVVGLILLFGLKFCLLLHLSTYVRHQPTVLLLLLVNAHTLSRFIASTFIFTHSYARTTDDSKAKPVTQASSFHTLLIAGILTLLPLLLFIILLQKPVVGLSIVLLYGLKLLLARYFVKWIGGYTGDCLGATQQVGEVGFYLFMAVVWKFT